MATMRFGLVPLWYRKSIRDWTATTFNARVEEVDTKATFKGAWRYRRCVVPAEAFYEWSGPKGDRTKWRITRADNQPLAFAGIWDQADLLEGEVFSFSLLTRTAGPDMSAIHTREPIVLGSDHWEDWVRMRSVDLRVHTPFRLSRMDEGKSHKTLDLF
jgi:putative SOS response-associated peptidase YedK